MESDGEESDEEEEESKLDHVDEVQMQSVHGIHYEDLTFSNPMSHHQSKKKIFLFWSIMILTNLTVGIFLVFYSVICTPNLCLNKDSKWFQILRGWGIGNRLRHNHQPPTTTPNYCPCYIPIL